LAAVPSLVADRLVVNCWTSSALPTLASPRIKMRMLISSSDGDEGYGGGGSGSA
jgi:hypothetical protein